jgi:SAM-dependent methyltransferase
MYAAKVGNQAIGLSFDESNNHKARRRARILEISSVDFVEVDLRDLTMVSDQLGPFDQVICFETIEHILDDRKLLRDLSSALKPGGRFLLTTPFKGYKPLLGDRVSGIEDGGHVRWGYTHIEIQTLFDECGLDVQVQEYISGYVSQRLCNLMRLLGRIDANLARVAVFPLRIFQCIDGPLTNFIRYPFASIAVVGVKRKGSTAKSTRYHTPKYIGQDGR